MHSSQNISNDFCFLHAGEFEIQSLESVGEMFVVDAEEVQDGGVEIIDVNWIPGDVVTEIVGFAPGHAGFDAAASHPHGEASWMMVATSFGAVPFALACHASSEFPSPEDQSVVQ